MTSAFYREQARESLRGNWGKAIIVCLLGTLLGADVVTLGTVENRRDSIQDNIEYFRHTVDSSVFRMFLLIFLGVVSIILVYSIIAFIIGGAIQLGMITFFIGLHQGEQVRVSDLFSQFQSFGKALGLRIVTVFFVWLWSLLLVIPGLIAVFRYSMAPYILAENPDIRFIVSNTTEAGIEFVPENKFEDKPAKSFPGKLTQLLYKRFKLGLPGFIILSCELIDHNGEELEKCCMQYADLWGLGEDFKTWMKKENDFCSTLVDRIVTGFPRDEHAALCERIGEQDNMMDTAEIFHLWVIQGHHEEELPLQKAGFHVVWTDNVDPYKKRKVRILNGAHTGFVLGAYLAGQDIVRDCMHNETIKGFMNKMLYDEVIPTLPLDRDDLMHFAAAVQDRFNNPFVNHELMSISLNSTSKWRARNMPSFLEYIKEKGELPKCLTMSLAACIAFYSNEVQGLTEAGLVCRRPKGNQYIVSDDRWVLEFYNDHKDDAPETLVKAVLTNEKMWGQDLTQIAGLAEQVTANLKQIRTEGALAAYASCL